MYIVAIGWLYVVVLMAFSAHSFASGLMTFLVYGALPVGVLILISGSKRRHRRRRQAIEQAEASEGQGDNDRPTQ